MCKFQLSGWINAYSIADRGSDTSRFNRYASMLFSLRGRVQAAAAVRATEFRGQGTRQVESNTLLLVCLFETCCMHAEKLSPVCKILHIVNSSH
eukprot:1140231-Pelagomonas_calceolata.AAC.5